jgi:hypothetical protein
MDLFLQLAGLGLLLAMMGFVTLLWGIALFSSDNGTIDVVWVWRGDWLTSQLIGVMLLTISAACLYAYRAIDTAYLLLWGLMAYGIGLVLAGLWNVLADKPIPVGYVMVFGMMGLVSAGLLWLQKMEKHL